MWLNLGGVEVALFYGFFGCCSSGLLVGVVWMWLLGHIKFTLIVSVGRLRRVVVL